MVVLLSIPSPLPMKNRDCGLSISIRFIYKVRCWFSTINLIFCQSVQRTPTESRVEDPTNREFLIVTYHKRSFDYAQDDSGGGNNLICPSERSRRPCQSIVTYHKKILLRATIDVNS